MAVVTGGAGGIGLAICEALAASGVAIACLQHPDADTTAFRSVCERQNIDHLTLPADVTDQAALAVAVERARELGVVRYAVNCAGIHNSAPSESMGAGQWRQMIDVDLSGVFFACQAEYAAMADGGGSIVNIASMSGSIINRGAPASAYMAAKAAVVHVSRSLGVEWARRGIRVNSLSPGYTRTAMTAKNSEQVNAAFAADVPMGRMAEPAEIAGPVLFLLSAAAAYITAFDLLVDGGYTAW